MLPYLSVNLREQVAFYQEFTPAVIRHVVNPGRDLVHQDTVL
jgi:hypothetical protein